MKLQMDLNGPVGADLRYVPSSIISSCLGFDRSCSIFFIPSLLDPDAPPRGLNVTASSNGLRIAWEAPEILSGPTSYLVQVTEFYF